MRWTPYAIIAILLLLVVLLPVVAPRTDKTEIEYVPVAEPKDASVRGVRWCGGGKLVSSDYRFGGLSDVLFEHVPLMHVGARSYHLYFPSDTGHILEGEISVDDHGMITGFEPTQWMPVLDEDGGRAIGLRKDMEALRIDPNKQLWGAFEMEHRIQALNRTEEGWQLDESQNIPIDIAGWAEMNSGVEAFDFIGGKRFLAIAEKTPYEPKEGEDAELYEKGDFTTVLNHYRREWRTSPYALSDGFLPTGMTVLPSGDYLAVERQFSFSKGFRTRLSVLPYVQLSNFEMVTPLTIADITDYTFADNVEGIAMLPLKPKEGTRPKEVLMLFVSDDNLRFWQKSYLIGLCVRVR